jgi:thiamine-phosphate pyrophosphorylase
MLQKYLITSREFYTDTPAVFRRILHEQFVKHLPNFALYRDKSNPNYHIQAEHFIEVCAQFQDIKSFIHSDVELAFRLHAHGVHLTSTQFDEIQDAKELGLEVIISTHTKEEVLKAQTLGADYVTYSPIFTTPNKGEPKGIEDLKDVLETTEIKIFALGGIVEDEQIKSISQTDSFGFASIRYFY